MSKYEKRRPQAPKPAPSGKIFIGRERQIADFRASVSYLLGKATPPTDDFYPHLFIAYGEGGMGKTTLLDRWLEVARKEGMAAERIISVDLDYNIYPSPGTLADKIIAGLCRAFPDFDRGYRDVRVRREALKPRRDELRDQWERWQAHVESGTTDELMRAWNRQLSGAEIRQAKFGSLHAPVMLANEADDARRELRALRGFLDANGRGPQTFAELLERELGDDAALFDPATSAKALGDDIYRLAEERPLLLALDTYELADRHHDWLVELFLEAGEQVIMLLAGRNAVHKGDYHERRFSDDLRPLVQAYDLGNETFSAEEIRQFVAQTLGAEPDDGDVARIEQISRGVPLAVEALAGELKASGHLRMFADLDTRSDKRNEIIRKVTNRFMRYAVEDSKGDTAEDKARRQADRIAIRGLALLLRPDPEQICALWGCDDRAAEGRIGDLGGRHSFVFARSGSFEMHDLVRQFIREDLWHTKSKQFEWPRLREGLRRVLALVDDRLARYADMSREDAYDTAEFREAVLDRLNLLLWLDELEEGKRWLLNRWLEARHYHRQLSNEMEKLLHELLPSQNTWRKLHELIVAETIRNPRPKKLDDQDDPLLSYTTWRASRQRNFAVFEPFINLLEPHPRMLYYYLWADQDEVFDVSNEDDLQMITQNIVLLEQASHLDPTFTPASEMLARVLSRRGRYCAWEGKEYTQAIADLDRVLEINPEDSYAYFNRANANHELRNYTAAITDYDRALALNPNDVDASNNRGNAKADLKDYVGAILDYDHAININPEYAVAFYNRGLAKADLKDYADALRDYDRAIELNSEYTNAFINRGNAKAALENYAAAILDYDHVIELNPEYASAFYNRGNTKADLQDYAAAILDYDRAIELNPEDAAAFNNRGNANYKLGNYANAIVDFDYAIAIDAEKFNTFMNRGVCRRYLGDFAGALADFEQALLINPEYYDSMYNLACYFSAIQRDVDVALIWLQQAIDGDPLNRDSAISDLDFDPIREDPRFRALVGE